MQPLTVDHPRAWSLGEKRFGASSGYKVLVDLSHDCLQRGQYKLAVRHAYLLTALGGQLPDEMIGPLQSAIASCRSGELHAMWEAASRWAGQSCADIAAERCRDF